MDGMCGVCLFLGLGYYGILWDFWEKILWSFFIDAINE